MDILIKAAQLLMSLSILVILHEFGHYLPAKIFKTRVEKFYLFFDPWFSIFKKKIGETEYGIGWLPLGGYVKIAGMIDESMDKEQMAKPPELWEFRSKPAWQRLIIMVGGVFVNVIVAVVIYACTLSYWGEEYLPNKNVTYGVTCDSLALEMGIKNGDKIVSIDGVQPDNFNRIPIEIILNEPKQITVERNGKKFSIPVTNQHIKHLIKTQSFVTPRLPYWVGDFTDNSKGKEAGLKVGDKVIAFNGKELLFFDQYVDAIPQYANEKITLTVNRNNTVMDVILIVPESGKIGVYPHAVLQDFFEIKTIKYGFFESIPAGAKKSYNVLVDYVKQFGLIFNTETEAYKSVGGFLTIGSMFPSTWDWQFFWNFTAFLSIMLAFLNILPIPALDGGHVMFVLYEIVTGRTAPQKVLEYAQIIGLIIILFLFVVANGNDILKFF